jgi:cell division protein FtsW (lipid II flippase)
VWVSILLGLIFMFTVGMQFGYIKKRLEFFLHPEIDKTEQ